MIKDRACKITAMSTSKTGKHGHAKCKFVGVGIDQRDLAAAAG